jgi:hypothetical protein
MHLKLLFVCLLVGLPFLGSFGMETYEQKRQRIEGTESAYFQHVGSAQKRRF